MQKEYVGSTLVKYLAVLFIIVIVAAILYPVTASVRKKSTCLSNLKQIGSALKMYVDDNNGTYMANPFDPMGQYGPNVHHFWTTKFWSDLLLPYAKGKDIFSCPAVSDFTIREGCTTPDPSWFGSVYSANPPNYLNGYGLMRTIFGRDARPCKITDVSKPSRVGLIADAHCPFQDVDTCINGIHYMTRSEINSAWEYGWATHGDGCNFLFADGHSKSISKVLPNPKPNGNGSDTYYYPDVLQY